MKLLVLVGSTHAGGYNDRLAEIAVRELPAEVEVSRFDLSTLPFYDEVADAEIGLDEQSIAVVEAGERLAGFFSTAAILKVAAWTAALAASGTVMTFRPASSAFFQLALSSRRPTTTFMPLSCRFCACAWPWLP